MSLATPVKLRRLQEALNTKAKQDPACRVYLLYDKMHRADMLAHAYALSQQHGGHRAWTARRSRTSKQREWSHGWLKDRFGVSWQAVPTVLIEMLQDKDPPKAKRVMAAMLKMKKISIEELRQAYEGR